MAQNANYDGLSTSLPTVEEVRQVCALEESCHTLTCCLVLASTNAPITF